jgi:hypothetical protein
MTGAVCCARALNGQAAAQKADEVAPSHASPQNGLDTLRTADYAETTWEFKLRPCENRSLFRAMMRFQY